MAKRNQVTTNLKITADAELKGSRNFIKKIEKIAEGLDVGTKLYGQLNKATDQLKEYNKVLEKVQNKSFITEEENKNLAKAGKEIANIIEKTENLYNSFSASDLKKFSKEYINQVKETEKEIAKIKENYTKTTGRDSLDKDIKNLDKYTKKIEALTKKQKELKDGQGIEIKNRIDAENKALQEQFNIYKKIEAVEKQRNSKKQEIISKYNNSNNIKLPSSGKIKTDTDSVRKDISNSKYQQIVNTYEKIARARKEILENGKTDKQIEKDLISLAKQYFSEKVKTTAQFEKQFKILQENKKFYNSLNNRNQLTSEKEITAEIERRNKLLKEIDNENNKILNANGFVSDANLTNKKRVASRVLNSSSVETSDNGAKLTSDAESQIADDVVAATNRQTKEITNELNTLSDLVKTINGYNAKLATQSERVADEQDIKIGANQSIQATNKDGNTTRKMVAEKNKELEKQIIAKESLTMGNVLKDTLKETPSFEDLMFSGILPQGQLDLKDTEKSKKFDSLQNDYLSRVDDLHRKAEMLRSELSAAEYEIIGQDGLENLTEAKSILNKIISMMKHSKAEEMALLKQEQDMMVKHNSKGETIFKDGMPSLKKGGTLEEYNNVQKRIQKLAQEYNQIDQAQTKLNVDFTQGENQLRNYNKFLKTYNADLKTTKKDTLNFSNTINEDAQALQNAVEQSQFLSSTFDDLRNKIGYFLSMNYVFDQLTRKVKEASDFTKNLDKDMTQIGLVLGQTSSQTWKNFDTYAQMADRLNTTVSDVTASMKLFYQQGLNTVEVNKMVEASAIAAALGESTMAEASETLTSIINSYNLSANQAIEVTDKISMVAMVSAADFGELSTAIEKVASSAASAGLDLDHMMGYLAKMIETTREAPTNIGTALKTIVANFTQFKEDPSGLTEEGSEINKVDKALKSVGINLTDTTGEVRDLSEVLDELGKKWNGLTRNQKSYLATAIAGTRQQSRFYALMNDYNRTLELVEESTNSDGKATEQFALYQDSLTASTERLNNEWEKFYNNILKNDSGLKILKNGLSALLKIANKIGPTLTTIFGMGLLGGTRKVFTQILKIRNEIKKLNQDMLSAEKINRKILSGQNVLEGYNFNNRQNNKKGLNKVTNNFGNSIAQRLFSKNGGNEQVEKLKELQNLQKIVEEGDKKLISANKELIESTLNVTLSEEELNGTISNTTRTKMASTVQTQAETVAHTASASVKWAEVAAQVALNLAIMAGIAAIGLFVGWLIKQANAEHEAAIAAQEKAKASKEEAQNVEELINSYKELSKKTILTNDEKQQLSDTISNLIEQYPELIDSIDAEGNAYLVANSKLEKFLANKQLEAELDKEDAANKSLKDKKTKDNAYEDKNILAWGASKNKDNFLSASLEDSSKGLQIAIDNLKNFTHETTKIGFFSQPKKVKEKDYEKTAKTIEEKIANGKIDEAIQLVQQKKKKNNWGYSQEEQTQIEGLLEKTELRLTQYKNSLQSSYADVAKNKYGATVTRYAQDNNFSDEQLNVAQGLLQNYYKEQMNNYSSGEEMKNAIKDGKLKDGIDSILEQVALLTNNEIEDYNKLISNYKTGDISLDDLKNNLDSYSGAIKDLANKYVQEAEDEINNMAKVDIDKYSQPDYGKGNIDLNNRPTYKNEDGSISTVDSTSINIDGIEVLLPSVWKNQDGSVIHADTGTEEGLNQIIQHYEETGEYLGKFKTSIEADAYALQLHEQQQKQYNEKSNQEQIERQRTENLSLVNGKTRELLASAKNNFQGGTDFTEEQFDLAFGNALDNEDFLLDLQNLDTTSMTDIENFKAKYAESLGIYGQKFLDELIKNPEYDAEKVQSKLTTAQSGMSTQNKHGISFNDISQGSISQEDVFNELTNEGENARRNIELVGKDLIVTGQEIADSFSQSQKDAIDTLSQIINKADENIQTYQNRLDELDSKGIENLNNEEKKEYQQLQKNISSEQNRIIKAKELAEAYSKVSIEQDAINKNQNVITGFAAVNKEINSLKDLADMYQYVGNARMSQLDIIQAVAENTDLLTALEVNEQGQLYLTKEGIEAVAAERIGDAKATVDAQIAKLEALKSMIDGDQVYSEYELEMLEEMATQWSNLSDDEKNALVAMAQQLGYNVTSMDQWTTFVQKDLEGARKAWNEYYKASEGKDSNSAITGSSGGGVTTSSSTKEETKTKGEQKKKEIQAEIDRLKAVSTKLGSYQKNPGSLLKDINKLGDYKSGGSDKDKFDPVEDELEKFYNYLRKIEKIEAKLTQMRSKRSLIDQGKNYYIEDLKQENELLTEQQKLYRSYMNDESAYLQELRNQLEGAYSQWVSFNNEGVIQVKQTEFVANSEEEQAYLEEFMDLQQKYQDEYNTREDNKNKLLEIENTQLENIKTMYEKILARVTDVNEAIQRQVDLLDHDITMSFSNIAKFDIMDDKMAKAVEGIKNSYSYINDFEKQVSELNKQVKNGPFAELLLWDEALEIWRVNEEKLNDPAIISKYEKLGYNWQDIDTYVRSVAVKSQSINSSMKETVDSAHEFAETLKGLIDDRISAIQDYFSAASDELNKVFDSFDNKIEEVDNRNSYFGTTSEALEEKYLALVSATAILKQTLQQLTTNKDNILSIIEKKYPEYITMVNGVAVVNKQAAQESSKLTEEQKAELLQLIGVYEASADQIEELESKLNDYFSSMVEMEREKRDAIIEMKTKIHDELMTRDQQEIDDLRTKYDKMSELDNEYYSELSQRISDARNLRSQRQESNNIGTMQAQLATLKTDNSGTYNAQIIELQKQLNEALQNQADNEVDRELERIQREQQQREEDRQLQISAMENVLTFKDENNWYWQEANKIWSEGPESVTGWLASSREYMNISDEDRASQFENLSNTMNTAFTNLQTAAGYSDRLSDGVVSNKADEIKSKLDNTNNNLSFINDRLGLNNTQLVFSTEKISENLDSKTKEVVQGITTVKDNLLKYYETKVTPGMNGIQDLIKGYLGGESAPVLKSLGNLVDSVSAMNGSIASILEGYSSVLTTFSNTIIEGIKTATKEYLETDNKLYKWLQEKYGIKTAEEKKTTQVSTPQPSKNNTNASNSNNKNNNAGRGNSSAGKNVKVGGYVKASSGAKIYTTMSGGSGQSQYYSNDPKYKVLQVSGKRALVRYHKLNSGYTGWFNLSDLTGYSKGGYVNYTGLAAVHGKTNNPEAFLNAKQTALFETLRDTLTRATSTKGIKNSNESAKEEYNIENISIEVKQVADVDEIEKVTRKVKEQIYKDSIGKNNMAVRRR